MEIGDKITLGFFGLFAFCGTVCAILAYVNYQSTYRIVRNGIETEGVVIDIYSPPRAVGKSVSTAMAPIVQFRTESGALVQYASTTFTTPVSHPVGATLKMWYLKDDPKTVVLEGADSWLIPAVLGGFGIIFCLIGWPTVLRMLFQS